MADGDRPLDVETRRRLRQLIVHDLRSPLSVILGQCDLLAMRNTLSQADERSLAAIERASRGLLAMIDEAGDLLPKS